MDEFVVSASDAGQRLDVWLARRTDAGSRARATAWIARGKVFLNGREATAPDGGTPVTAGDRVGLWIDRPGSASPSDRAVAKARAALRIVHEDRTLIVVDKPVGLLVEPLPGGANCEPTMLDLLEDRDRHLPRARRFVVHRIDRDTSGLVLFARTAAARDHLKAQFEARTPDRVYLAVVLGDVSGEGGTWRDRLAWDKSRLRQRRAHATDAGGKEAMARYRVRERFGVATLLEVSLVTGKRNQIRIQAAMRGHPLLGERQYRLGAPDEPPGVPRIERQALHAWRLRFEHPESGRRVLFTSECPPDIEGLVQALRRQRTSGTGGGRLGGRDAAGAPARPAAGLSGSGRTSADSRRPTGRRRH